MRPFTSTISLEEARQRLTAAVRPIDRTERLALRDAAGRVAAADVASAMYVPPFSRSAMDGYAVRFSDLQQHGETTLRVAGTAFAGEPFSGAMQAGECVRIMTGGVVPVPSVYLMASE